jgi:hypothetical protein
MNLLRSLLAVLFAIAIANPACCCTVRPHEEPAKASHCCGGGTKKEKPTDEACACAAKSPKKAEDPTALPVYKAIELPPVLSSFVEVIVPERVIKEVGRPDFQLDTGPPRLRLAMLQRFLI